MTEKEIKQVIVDIINEILADEEVELSDINPEERLRDQLDLDSMDFLDIVMELRKRYGIEIPEADYPQLATLNSCVKYLFPKMASL